MNCQSHLYATFPRGAGPPLVSERVRRRARGRSRWANWRVTCGRARAPIRSRAKQPPIRAAGEERDLSVHGRRSEPSRAVRLQAAAGQVRRHAAAGGTAEGLSRRVHQSEFEAAGAEVQVRQAWPVRRRAFGAAASSGGSRRRHGDRQVDGDRRVQSRPRPDPDEHRLAAVRQAEHRRLDAVRPGERIAESARVRRLQHGQKRGRAAATRTGAAAICRRCTRECSSARAAIRCCTCRIRAASTTSCSAIRSTRSTSSTGSIWPKSGDPEIATRINSFEMAYRMQAKAPEAIEFRKSRSIFSRCTAPSRASLRSRTPACWPGG